MSRTNAQVALEAASTLHSGREHVSPQWVLSMAKTYLDWLDEQDRTAEKPDPVSVVKP
jgi:hypothetical protein